MPDDNQNKIPKHSQSITQQCTQYIWRHLFSVLICDHRNLKHVSALSYTHSLLPHGPHNLGWVAQALGQFNGNTEGESAELAGSPSPFIR